MDSFKGQMTVTAVFLGGMKLNRVIQINGIDTINAVGVSENGTPSAQYLYDAFGNTIAKSGTLVDTFNFWFSTKYLDHETGLYYYGYRFYDPVLMRWLNRDPIEEQGEVNIYVFAGNNGVNKTDINGLIAVKACCGQVDYNPSTHCCCGKTIQCRKKIDTGVKICKQYGRPILGYTFGNHILKHSWIEIDGSVGAIGFYPEGIDFDDSYRLYNETFNNRYPVVEKRCEPILISPCEYDLEIFRAHIFYSTNNYKLPYHDLLNNCYVFIQFTIQTSLIAAQGCTQ